MPALLSHAQPSALLRTPFWRPFLLFRTFRSLALEKITTEQRKSGVSDQLPGNEHSGGSAEGGKIRRLRFRPGGLIAAAMLAVVLAGTAFAANLFGLKSLIVTDPYDDTVGYPPLNARCDAAMKICLSQIPEELSINDEHKASCWMNVKADMEAAEASLKSAQASVELIQAQIAKTEVRAPFAGTLGFVNVSVGAWLATGTPVATLSDVKELKAKFALPQRYASTLKAGDPVNIKDEERGIEKTAKVKALDATLSESSRTRQVMVLVENAKGELLAGSYAKVNVTVASGRTTSIPVPAEAITLDKDGAYVFVATGGKAKIKHVETGLRTPISVDVVSGLAEGDTVISSGLISLREGSAVRIREIRHNTDYEVE